MNFADSLTADVERLEGDQQVIERLPRESFESLHARCAKSAPHITHWMLVPPGY